MTAINNDDKLLTTLGKSTMMVIGSVSILYMLQLLLPQQAQAQGDLTGSLLLNIFGMSGYSTNIDYGANFEVLHVGEAVPGTLNNVPGWRIYRYGYVIVDGDPEVSEVKFASGTKSFDKVWDNRADYEYS